MNKSKPTKVCLVKSCEFSNGTRENIRMFRYVFIFVHVNNCSIAIQAENPSICISTKLIISVKYVIYVNVVNVIL